MSQPAHLEWERRIARPAAAAAFAAVALQVAGQILGVSALRGQPPEDRGQLHAIDERTGELVLSTIARSFATLLIAASLYYLYRCVRHRRQLPPYFVVLLIAAPVVLAVGSGLGQAQAIEIAGDFTGSGAQDEARADDLIKDQSAVAASLVFGGRLALAFGYVVISLNAMRAGLLSRFMGIIGIIVGVLYVLGGYVLGGQPVEVEVFWLAALGFLFLGLWPRGRGPAWDSGKEEPWPSQASLLSPQPREEEEPEPPPTEDRPPSRKRKRRKS